eukprot:m.192546 g.192546  ORF g.192546 m.192546 type:complete len:328 (-) comp18675_c0_seq1:389-1372(-)
MRREIKRQAREHVAMMAAARDTNSRGASTQEDQPASSNKEPEPAILVKLPGFVSSRPSGPPSVNKVTPSPMQPATDPPPSSIPMTPSTTAPQPMASTPATRVKQPTEPPSTKKPRQPKQRKQLKQEAPRSKAGSTHRGSKAKTKPTVVTPTPVNRNGTDGTGTATTATTPQSAGTKRKARSTQKATSAHHNGAASTASSAPPKSKSPSTSTSTSPSSTHTQRRPDGCGGPRVACDLCGVLVTVAGLPLHVDQFHRETKQAAPKRRRTHNSMQNEWMHLLVAESAGQPAHQSESRPGDAEEDACNVPCDKCGKLVPFSDYLAHWSGHY